MEEVAALFGNMAGAVFACFIVALFLHGAIWKLEESAPSLSQGLLIEFVKDLLFSSLWFLGCLGVALLVVFALTYSIS